jgi:HSP20 family molecular chaperone IbpA
MIESHRLTVSGRRTITEHRQHDNIVYLDQCPDLMFRILQLPVQVDPNRSTAILRGGILEISLPTLLTEPNTLFRADTQWVA